MENDVINKLSKFALGSAYAGLLTVGICPAFGIIGISVSLVLRSKLKDLDEDTARKTKTAIIAGIISLLIFPADIALAYFLLNK